MPDLRDVAVGVTSFLRPKHLSLCLTSLRETLPDCPIIVADDGDIGLPDNWFSPTTWIQMPFDSGLSAKRNAIVQACQTPFLLMFCDDFMADEECRAGVIGACEWLRGWCGVSVVGGRVDGRPYECDLEWSGNSIRETRLNSRVRAPLISNGLKAWPVDLTANYFLAVTNEILNVPWFEECKIGGEHGAWFLDLKLAGRRVVWMPGFNVKTMTLGPEAEDPRYRQFRGRAYELGHQAMKRRYKIEKYIDMNGAIS